MGFRQARYDEPFIRDYHSGSTFFSRHEDLPDWLPKELRRETVPIPDVSEYDVIKHFTRLSQMNFSVDTGLYPLGSCTMKFNPKYADKIAAIPEFSELHPQTDEPMMQGSLQIMYELQEMLKAISHMDEVSLQPLAGAQGEFTGIRIIKKFFENAGKADVRDEILIPDSAHGTNPASAAMGGFKTVEIPSNENGTVDVDALKAAISERTAAFMITNPNTLGIFEGRIEEIARIIHDAGAFLYYDGANFNAILGKTAPGKMGFDITHFNLHKTFATPHGGGGPGAGPVGVRGELKEYLPSPIVRLRDGNYVLDYSMKHSIGKIAGFYGNFGVLLRAWAYIKRNGSDGLKEVSESAVLNTNYLTKRIAGTYEVPNGGVKKHEVAVSSEKTGRRALDIAKYLLDMGFHSPTIYFPLTVHEALMIEVTESASKAEIDAYVDAMINAASEPIENLKQMPKNTSVGRVDEVKAARDLKLKW